MQPPGDFQPSSPAPIAVSTIRGASAAVDLGVAADTSLRKQAGVVALVSASLIAFGMLWLTLAR